jgi:hypothetical protein
MGVDSERGFINQVYRLTGGIADRMRFFGRKNWRRYGRSLHCLDKYLESAQPAYAVRAGKIRPEFEGDDVSTLAGNSFAVSKFPGGFGFVNQQGKVLSSDSFNGLELNITGNTATVQFTNYRLTNSQYIRINTEQYKWLTNNVTAVGTPNPVPQPMIANLMEDNGTGFWQVKGEDTEFAVDGVNTPVNNTTTNTWWLEIDGVNTDTEIPNEIPDPDWKPAVAPFAMADYGFVNDSCETNPLPWDGINGFNPTTFQLFDETGTAQTDPEFWLDIANKARAITISSTEIPVVAGDRITVIDKDGVQSFLTFMELPDGHFFPARWWGIGGEDTPTGRAQYEVGPNTFEDDPVVCDFFAKGEGEWGKNIRITLTQRAFVYLTPVVTEIRVINNVKYAYTVKEDPFAIEHNDPDVPGTKNWFTQVFVINEENFVQTHDVTNLVKPWDRFEAGSGDGARIFGMTVTDGVNELESYADVSFNSHDVNGQGVSIYIENVLANSNYIGCVVNSNHPDIGELLNNIQVLPRREEVDSLGARRFIYSEVVNLVGGKVVDISTRSISLEARSAYFDKALDKILTNHVIYDAMILLNAGQEIINPEFDRIVADYKRGMGFTTCPMEEAFLQDVVPEGTGGVTGNFVAKYNQYILGLDSDSGQDIYTPVASWVAKTVGQNAIAGQLWYAPAGPRRGILQGALGVSRTWTDKQRLENKRWQWNPIKMDPTGFTIWEAVTAQPIETALSDIHVNLAYFAMMRAIERTLEPFPFEFNDQGTVDVILNLLSTLAEDYVNEKAAEQIIVDAAQNVIGSDQIRIRWNFRPKGVARTIVVDIIAYPQTQELEFSMSLAA